MTYDGTRGPILYYTLPIYELGDYPELVDHINTAVVGICNGKPVFLVRSQEPLDPPCEPIEKHEIKNYFFKNMEDPDE